MGKNLLNDNDINGNSNGWPGLNTQWRVIFNKKNIKGNELKYTDQDKEIIKGIADARISDLNKKFSLNDKIPYEITKILTKLKDYADRSKVKEQDFFQLLLDNSQFSNQEKSKLDQIIKNFYADNDSKFSDLINNNKVNSIVYTKDVAMAINSLFWGDLGQNSNQLSPQSSNSENYQEFLKAIAMLRSQDFFTTATYTSRFKSQAEQQTNATIKSKPIKIAAKELKELEKQIQDVDQPNSFLKNFFGDINKYNDILDKIRKMDPTTFQQEKTNLASTLCKEIISSLKKIFDIETKYEIAGSIKQQVIDAPDNLLDKIGDDILDSTQKALIRKQLNTSSTYTYTAITLKGQTVQVNYKNQIMTIDLTPLEKPIQNEIESCFDTARTNSGFTSFGMQNRIKAVIKQNLKQCIQGTTDLTSKDISSITAYFLKITDKQLNLIKTIDTTINSFLVKHKLSFNSTIKDLKLARDALKKEVSIANNQLIPKLLKIWHKIIRREIYSLNVDHKKVFSYYRQIQSKIDDAIKDDVANNASDLEQELLKAVLQYYKLSWNDPGRGGSVNIFNGTISEIFITVLFRLYFEANPDVIINQKGSDTSQNGQQSVTDIEVTWKDNNDNIKGVGMQAKHLATNDETLYGSSTAPLKDASRYFDRETNVALLYILGNITFLTGNIDDYAGKLLPYLYHNLGGFIRFEHGSITNALQNNFYIINLNVVPASVIFLLCAEDIYKEYGNNAQGIIKNKEGNLFQIKISPAGLNGMKAYKKDEPYYGIFADTSNNILSRGSSDDLDNYLSAFTIKFAGRKINLAELGLEVFKKPK